MVQIAVHPSGVGSDLLNAKRLVDEVNARPAAVRARALATQHQYKSEMDADAHAQMFPQNRHLTVI